MGWNCGKYGVLGRGNFEWWKREGDRSKVFSFKEILESVILISGKVVWNNAVREVVRWRETILFLLGWYVIDLFESWLVRGKYFEGKKIKTYRNDR